MEFLDSRRLKHFLAVYDLRSIGQASEKLFITQPALSKSIRKLEEDLEVPLFERTPLGVVPTVFGEALAQHAKVIRAEIRHAETEIINLRGGVKGQVTVGVGPSVAANLMPLATRRMRAKQPGIRFTVIEGLVDKLIPALRRGEIEIAVGEWPPIADADLAVEVVLRDTVCVVAGRRHPLAQKKRVKLSELLEFPWVLPPENQRWRHVLEETFINEGLSAPIAETTSNSASYIRTVLLDNESLSFLPLQMLPRHRKQMTGLAPIACEILKRDVDVTATYRERTLLSPAAHALLSALREVDEG